jgi:hypothetical protein
MLKALGQRNAFFLDTLGDWRRLIDRTINLLDERAKQVQESC